MNRQILMAPAVTAGIFWLAATAVKDTWGKKCTRCGGADRKAGTKMGKNLEMNEFPDAKYQQLMKDEQILKVTLAPTGTVDLAFPFDIVLPLAREVRVK